MGASPGRLKPVFGQVHLPVPQALVLLVAVAVAVVAELLDHIMPSPYPRQPRCLL